jgi:hypothetical protein
MQPTCTKATSAAASTSRAWSSGGAAGRAFEAWVADDVTEVLLPRGLAVAWDAEVQWEIRLGFARVAFCWSIY